MLRLLFRGSIVIEISAEKRRELRAKAHHLKPVVTVAAKGLSVPVVAEIERALLAHHLIKVKVAGADRESRADLMVALCDMVGAAPVQSIGNLLVIWREPPEEIPEPASSKAGFVARAQQSARRADARRSDSKARHRR